MFLLHLTQFILQIVDVYNAFIVHRIDPGPTGYFLDYGSIILPIRDAVYWLSTWRLYVIWGQNKRVIIGPIILLTAATTTGIVMFTYTLLRAIEGTSRLNATVDSWWMATLGIMIAVNLLVPGLIVGRLWFLSHRLSEIGNIVQGSPYKKIAGALIESGGLYTCALIAWLIIFATGSLPALYMSACWLPSIVAMVPCLIVIRLNTIALGTRSQSHFTGNTPSGNVPATQLTIMFQRTTQKSTYPPSEANASVTSLGGGEDVAKVSFGATDTKSERSDIEMGVVDKKDGYTSNHAI
ncbi:hypothetical protein FRC02_002593 [Tulasnella sp. 418]|nr:hypothetical protein FRC02_002593 [Tulasnella sp. 418]